MLHLADDKGEMSHLNVTPVREFQQLLMARASMFIIIIR